MNERESLRPARAVPDFRGLDFLAATKLAEHAEVKPADPDPDAPPISARWWNTTLVVASQYPEPGTHVRQWDSVAITLAPPESPVGARASTQPGPVLKAEASPESGVDVRRLPPTE